MMSSMSLTGETRPSFKHGSFFSYATCLVALFDLRTPRTLDVRLSPSWFTVRPGWSPALPGSLSLGQQAIDPIMHCLIYSPLLVLLHTSTTWTQKSLKVQLVSVESRCG